jgi:hypothetical protein
MKRLLLAVGLVWLATGEGLAQPYGGLPVLRAPTTGLTLTYATGTVTVGGWQTVLPLGSITVADNRYSCSAPQFAACNLIYWAGTGTALLTTTDPTVAFTPGMAVVAYVTTRGGVVVNIVYPPTSTQLVPAGVVTSSGAMRLPLCNSLLTQGCQAATKSLSGY